MIKRTLNNKKGSTLIMVLMSLSVLSILGTAILSASVMNFKMKKIDMKSKQSFYLAESGLEEAYVVIEDVVNEGVTEGRKRVDEKLKEIEDLVRKISKVQEKDISAEAYKKEVDDLYEQIKAISTHVNKDGSINDEEEFKNDMQVWFAQGYEDEAGIKQQGYKAYIDKHLVGELRNEANIHMSSVDIKDYSKYSDGFNTFELILESSAIKDKIEKRVESKFSIEIPDYYIDYSNKKIEEFTENVLWTKALLSDKDIKVKGEKVEVKGDIYAYGNKDNSNIKTKGIIVGYGDASGSLNVNGKVITGSYFQTGKDNSTINVVNNGEVFCNSLSIPDGNTGSNINIKGDVNTYDDIELNGSNANIYIDGSYYGFNDGSKENTKHDKSSGIVINNDSIGSDDSTIEITGEGKGKWYAPQYKGTFIAGTSYIELGDDPTEKKYYQTGESVSVKGNYKAYSDVYYDNEVYENLKKKYDSNLQSDDVKFDYFSPLILMDRVDSKSDPLYKQRKKYLMAVSEAKIDDNILNVGNGKINIKDVKYSIGAYIDDGNIKDGGVSIDYDKLFKKNQKEYDFYVNAMGDPQVDIDEILKNEENHTFSKINISNMLNFKTINTDDKEDKNKDTEKKDYREIIYINSNTGYTLEGKGGKIKGIIITGGDVHISGDVDFEGTIITQGNIYIEGNKSKKFSNDYGRNKLNSYILNKLSQNEELKNLFKKTGNKKIKVLCNLKESEGQVSLSKFIKVSEWKKTK
ncbi:pilus assembly PilX family protein [Tepidibacter hydrothermalis]|uniref:Pilus assembly PilX N-terminal domain-containing protein n=1 Tax=Tepidibacter hydrothermalis TaxID=3036126 RepID=A0ABY8EDN4_9FIRM|nr:pilus assembly PilX N-terminal domain-containing protein [Tepidibacter hydrothermalis]WFD11046.1 pilus assembly PilX N-terminal domain-containing protein [Tepidibacter hydrothermalis]